MDKETYEASKAVAKATRTMLNLKYGHRKRLTKDEVWEKATLTRDITEVENWIDEVAKEYTEDRLHGHGGTILEAKNCPQCQQEESRVIHECSDGRLTHREYSDGGNTID
jgi:hypothetical protein